MKAQSTSLKLPDVRPLDERISKNRAKELRKGLKKRILIVPQGVTGSQLKLWQEANKETLSMEPDYIKKYKHIMK